MSSEGAREASGASLSTMVTFLAVAAAFCYALAAALQHAVAADPASFRRPAPADGEGAGFGASEGDGAATAAGASSAGDDGPGPGKPVGAGSGGRVGADGEPVGAAGFLANLARSPGWQVGNVLNAVGWGLQAAALAKGELAYVQPLLLLSVVMSLPLTAWIRRDPPGAREWSGAIILVLGVSGFLAGAEPGPPRGEVDPTSWTWAMLAVGAACALCLALARGERQATGLAVAAGLVFGLAAALTKATVDTGLGFLSHWPVYALAIATALGFYWMQRAFQSGPLAASFPVIIALDPLVSVLLGVLLFGEQVSTAPVHLAFAAAGAVATLVGIAVLSRSRFMDHGGEPA